MPDKIERSREVEKEKKLELKDDSVNTLTNPNTAHDELDTNPDLRDYILHVKIPKDRIAVLIGTKGATKFRISKETECKIFIDSETGVVEIKGTDALKVYQSKDIVSAIARGFSPEKALLLLRTDYVLEIINLKELVRSRNQIKRVKGRVIGEKGKSRTFIENITDTYLSVYGKTVSLIGPYDRIGIVRRGLMMLINGSPHSRVQTWLEKKMKEINPPNPLLQEVKDKITEDTGENHKL